MSETDVETVAKPRAKLWELFVVGTDAHLEDEHKQEDVWIQKPNPVEQREILNKANAMRVRILTLKSRDIPNDSDAKSIFVSQLYDNFPDRESQIDILISKELNENEQSVEAKLQAEDEWSEDGYYAGLTEAWFGGLRDVYLNGDNEENTEHAEAVRVFDELKRFRDTVTAQLVGVKESLRAKFDLSSNEDVQNEALDFIIGLGADEAWLREQRLQSLFHAVRETDDHTKRYFKDRAQVDLLPTDALAKLFKAWDELQILPTEGKD